MISGISLHIRSAVLRQYCTKGVRRVHIEKRIAQLGYELPAMPAAPRGSYMPYSKVGRIVYLSGHLPQLPDGSLMKGRLGETMDIPEGQHAAQMVTLQMLATLRGACGGDLDKVTKVLKLTGFVNSADAFSSQPAVINGCSDLLSEVFGAEIGRHARSAVGVNVLPLDVPVEIEGIFEVDE